MEYEEVQQTVARAWGSFNHQLKIAGFTTEQVEEFEWLLDLKDGYNKVFDAAMEAANG
ncbi:hypothetical protein PMW_02 [Pseudomonas phage phiPMW]|uniref:Uncharacterized protein n=1 Tax=Pseudomonas phage phiPMW TaxID=1815582 RepID=A0A1S5R174_9CAUD|nr:hypothetical protein FDG97_gp002 [Pseudomonas phage phiPMW]ANA49127.1 hypothetical protein PMW_02 [Pseudomonas phage phiPMW]